MDIDELPEDVHQLLDVIAHNQESQRTFSTGLFKAVLCHEFRYAREMWTKAKKREPDHAGLVQAARLAFESIARCFDDSVMEFIAPMEEPIVAWLVEGFEEGEDPKDEN